MPTNTVPEQYISLRVHNQALLHNQPTTDHTHSQVLKKWREVGVKDSEQLRKLLIQRSLQPLPGLGAQCLFDFIAAFGGCYIGYTSSVADDFPGRWVAGWLAGWLGSWVVLGASWLLRRLLTP